MLLREGRALLKRRGCLVQQDREALCGLPRPGRGFSGGAVSLCRSGTPLTRRNLALERGLPPEIRRLLTPRTSFSAVETLSVLPVLRLAWGRLTLIRTALAFIRGLLSRIRDPVALIRDPVALIRDPVALIRFSLALIRRSLPLIRPRRPPGPRPLTVASRSTLMAKPGPLLLQDLVVGPKTRRAALDVRRQALDLGVPGSVTVLPPTRPQPLQIRPI